MAEMRFSLSPLGFSHVPLTESINDIEFIVADATCWHLELEPHARVHQYHLNGDMVALETCRLMDRLDGERFDRFGFISNPPDMTGFRSSDRQSQTIVSTTNNVHFMDNICVNPKAD